MQTTTTTLLLASDDIRPGETIAMTHVSNAMGCTGENRSPQLRWSGAPAGTKSFALAMHDPDAPTTVGFTHWVLFDIPADRTELEQDIGKHHHPHYAKTGLNDMGKNAYGGPCPPPGDPPHRYQFTLYALDVPALEGADETLTYPRFRFLIREHVLASATLEGRFGLPG
jgi:Raf kinase inhibitor-like YbhB/YbcL family protein